MVLAVEQSARENTGFSLPPLSLSQMPSQAGLENARQAESLAEEFNTLRFDLQRPASNRAVILAAGQSCYIRGVAGVIMDLDETQLLGTGEFAHDGPKARFARALQSVLKSKSGLAIEFEPHSWLEYRSTTGRSEDAVCDSMASIASAQFGLNIYGHEIQRAAQETLESSWDQLINDVKQTPGNTELLESIKEKNIPLGVCSASSETFVDRALRHFDIAKHFDAFCCSAEKKLAPDCYSPDPVTRCCEMLNVNPAQTCMIGDSIADYAAAALAGLPIVILRVDEERKEEGIAKILRDIRGFREAFSQPQAESNVPDLIFTTDFENVRFTEAGMAAFPHYMIFN